MKANIYLVFWKYVKKLTVSFVLPFFFLTASAEAGKNSFSIVLPSANPGFMLSFEQGMQGANIYQIQGEKDLAEKLAFLPATELEELHNQIYGNAPSIFLENGEIHRSSDEVPTALILNDISQVDMLEENSEFFKRVKLLSIKLNYPDELASPIDCSELIGCTNLQYIYVVCYFDVTAEQLGRFLQNRDSRVLVLYGVTRDE